MRERMEIKPVPLEMQPNSPTIAFSVSFDYEDPNVAVKVASEFLNQILSEDATRRTNNATETTKILEERSRGWKASTMPLLQRLKR